ncbi:methyltransferase-like protein 27 [Montipora capricornis]|uniref:methyltransferase-like protein 27 n=1 Tax=Montipora capricornis TaxID=246305 RepID=UPI0035F12979
MAAESYESGYLKHYGPRFENVSYDSTEEIIKDVYANWASQYDKEVLQSARSSCHKPLVDYFDEAIKQDFPDMPKDQLKIIDAGAGTGILGRYLEMIGYTSLHALDISQEMLDEAKKKNVYKRFICASLSDKRIPEIETGEFDAMICAGTLVKGHVRSSALIEMIRMVKTGGLLCFTIRSKEVDNYQAKMDELVSERRWERVSKKEVPFYEAEDMPKKIMAFIYRVASH